MHLFLLQFTFPNLPFFKQHFYSINRHVTSYRSNRKLNYWHTTPQKMKFDITYLSLVVESLIGVLETKYFDIAMER